MSHAARSRSSAVRRSRRANTRTVERSFTLHEHVLEAVNAAVGAGEAENLSAFVEAAIEEKLRRSTRAKLYAAYAEASQDRRFVADMGAATAQFDAAVSDGVRDA